jgi:hypothetical protein
MLTPNLDCAQREGEGRGKTDVDDGLDLTEDSGDGLADEGDGVEEAGLADEDVEEDLVDTDELLRVQLVNDCGILGLNAVSILPRGKRRRCCRCQHQRRRGACPASGRWQLWPSRRCQ